MTCDSLPETDLPSSASVETSFALLNLSGTKKRFE